MCFDAERDGDIDIVITNNSEDHIVYYRNDTSNGNHYLSVKLAGAGNNRYGVGAKITVTTTSGSQIREIRAGNNYVSQNPLEVHVGLGAAQVADVTVLWPDGMESFLDGVSADQLLTVVHPDKRLSALRVRPASRADLDSLQFDEPAIAARGIRHQRVVAIVIRHLAIFEENDAACPSDGGETVGDDDDQPVPLGGQNGV